MNPIIDHPAEYYLEQIIDGIPFSLSRFGDGENIVMFGHPTMKQNCDGSKFLVELIEPMKQIFRNQYPYYHCLLDCSFNLNGELFKDFIEQTCPEMNFYNGEIWQHLSFDGRITELVKAMNTYKPCFVGGKSLRKVQYMKGFDEIMFIETPHKDSFLKFNEIFDEVMLMHSQGCRFFGFATGYTTKPLIDTLFPYIGANSFLIDFGSVFSPYCGKLIRDGMKYYGYQKFQPYTRLNLM